MTSNNDTDLVTQNLKDFGIDIQINVTDEGHKYMAILYKNDDTERNSAFLLSEDPDKNLNLLFGCCRNILYFIRHNKNPEEFPIVPTVCVDNKRLE